MVVGVIVAGVLFLLVYLWWTRWGGGGAFSVFTDHERAARRFAQQRAEWHASARTRADQELLLEAFEEMRYRAALQGMAAQREPLDHAEARRLANREVEYHRQRFERERWYDGPEF